MKGKPTIDPRRSNAADVAAWLAAYGSMAGLVDVNTYAFASVAAATRRGATGSAPNRESDIGTGPTADA